MLSVVIPYVDMMPVCWCGLSPVWGLSWLLPRSEERRVVYSHVRDVMTADAGEGVGIVTVDPGFVGATNIVADSKAYTAGGAVREKCPSVLHPRFECTEAEHKLRYVFSSVRYYRFSGP